MLNFFCILIVMDIISTLRNILNWNLVEEIIKKMLLVKLDDDTREEGLEIIVHKYSDKVLELPPDEVERELVNIYTEILGKKIDAEEIDTDEALEEIEDEEFLDEIEKNAEFIPEFKYISQMVKMNPEFKTILKQLRKQHNSDESDEKRSNESMYI